MSVPWYLMAKGKGGGGYKTASGPIVSINDALASPLRALTLGIDPVQDLHGYGSPWPSGGGKNKWNVPYSEPVTLSKVYTFDSPLPSGTYTVSYISADHVPTDNTFQFGYYKDTSASYVYTTIGSNSKVRTFTSPEPFSKIVLYSDKAYTESVGITTTFVGLMLEEASAPTPYAPYSNICPISGWDEANLWRTGINVWDEEWEVGQISATTGENATGQDRIRSKNYIPCLPGTSYGFAFPVEAHKATGDIRVAYYDSDKNFITMASWVITSQFTTNSKACYMRFYTNGAYGETYNNDISINYPSTDISYHAYTGTTYPITIPTPPGTVYGGYISVGADGSAELVVTHAEVDLGMLTWNKGTTQSVSYGEYTHFIATPTPAKAPNFNFISSCYKTVHTNRNSLNNGEMGVSNTNSSGYKAFAVRNDAYADSTETEFATAMSGQTIVYELATPITIPISAIEVATLAGQNVVWADCGDVTVEYLSAGGANPDLMKLAVAFMGRK